MKIYVTRNDNIFDRFVGKPVWIIEDFESGVVV